MFPIPFNFPFRKKDGSITTINKAIEDGSSPYELPVASATKLGGVKVGDNLSIDANGKLSASSGGNVFTHYVRIVTNSDVGAVVILSRNNNTPVTLEELHNLIYNNGTPLTLYCLNTYKSTSPSNIIISLTATETGFVFNQLSGSTTKALNVCSIDDVIF